MTFIQFVSSIVVATAFIGFPLPADPVVTEIGSRYVDCQAASGGDGSQEHPWSTLADASDATATTEEFSKLLFIDGTNCRGRLNIGRSGTASAPFFVGVNGGTTATLDGAGGGTVLVITDQEYITVDGLTLKNPQLQVNTPLAAIRVRAVNRLFVVGGV